MGGDELGPSVPEDTALGLYRIAQEAISNACRHSQTDRVDVNLLFSERGSIVQTIQDYGCGFDAEADTTTSGGYQLGLATMKERA